MPTMIQCEDCGEDTRVSVRILRDGDAGTVCPACAGEEMTPDRYAMAYGA